MIRVLIVDSHPLTRAGYRRFLETALAIDAIVEVGSYKDAMSRLIEPWSLMILDANIPDRTGFDLLREMRVREWRVPVLMTSSYGEAQYAEHALRAGATGYLPKSCTQSDFMHAVRVLLGGGRLNAVRSSGPEASAASEPSAAIRGPHERFSPREFQIFLKLAAGVRVMDASRQLNLTGKTTSTYRTRILKKLGIRAGRSNAELTAYALQHGLMQ